MFDQYSEGFASGVLVTWPFRLPLPTSEHELVEQLARTLKTAVLLESAAQPETWLTASEDGACRVTGVEYLDDGIELS